MENTAHICECGNHAWTCIPRAYVSLVDPDMAPLLTMWNWCGNDANRAIHVQRSRTVSFNGGKIFTSITLHKIIMPLPKPLVVDHKNGNGLDNRLSNLRAVTSEINSQASMKRKGSQSIYKGVCHATGGRWRAQINKGGKQTFLGKFLSEVDAAKAYDNAARQMFGMSASTNFAYGSAP